MLCVISRDMRYSDTYTRREQYDPRMHIQECGAISLRSLYTQYSVKSTLVFIVIMFDISGIVHPSADCVVG